VSLLAATPTVADTPVHPGVWRVERMRSLLADPFLPGEWDPTRLLLIPKPGGLLGRPQPCAVPACPGAGEGTHRLCPSHRPQFARSGADCVEDWIVADGPGPRRRRISEEHCRIGDEPDGGCPRPAWGPLGLCVSHGQAWTKQQARGLSFAAFMAQARPLPSFGDCTAGCCYRVSAHALGFCETHYRMWIASGSPRGTALEQWRQRIRQPSSAQVVSLRGLPELVRLEVLYSIQCRLADQVRTVPGNVTGFVDLLRALQLGSVLEFDPGLIDPTGHRDQGRFGRYTLDRVELAYRDPEAELAKDCWDLRVLGRRGQLDFSPIRQDWLRQATKRWAAAAMGRVKDNPTLQSRVRAIAVLSQVLASGPGGGHDPGALGRDDVDRFLLRLRSRRSPAGQPLSANSAFTIAKACALVVREATEMGFLPELSPTFSFRRGDAHWPVVEEEQGRALPAHVIAQLDAHIDLLATIPGSSKGPAHRSLGVLGDRAGTAAVLAYRLLKGTGRRLGEVASLHLDCLDVDENAKAVLVYDNHKAGRMRRRLPLADTDLVQAIHDQQRWVAQRFPQTPRDRLWLFPRPNKNSDGGAHIGAGQLNIWIRAWVDAIPRIDAGPIDEDGEPIPFQRAVITPHSFRHTYAQTLADEGVPAPVLRDLMDHQQIDTTMGYYRVAETKKRAAMELLARHTIDNRGTLRPGLGPASRAGQLREQLSWVAVPMGKCSEPTNVRSGGQACPIRYQCTGCPHFESDPSYLPELRAYADQLRREREASLAMETSQWVTDNVSRQLGVISEHIRSHEQHLEELPADQRTLIEEASVTVRKARRSIPVALSRRPPDKRRD
jgi:integrase